MLLTPEAVTTMRAELRRMEAELAGVEKLRQGRDKLAAFLAEFAPEDGAAVAASAATVAPENPFATLPAAPTNVVAMERRKPKNGFARNPFSKANQIVDAVARFLVNVPGYEVPYLTAWNALPDNVRANTSAEYGRTCVKRNGHLRGIMYDTTTARVSLHKSPGSAASLPGLGA
jgi:hypothetical protein